jgi:alpha-beta hydrolase superfamily lysophospholipase
MMAIHGGLAHAGDYVTPALYFMEKGIATVAYDLRGHKQEKVYIKNFDQFLEDTDLFLQWTKKTYKDVPIFIMGHSMGGLISTHFGIKYAENDAVIKGYIFSSPYYQNAIKLPRIITPLISIFSKIIPKAVLNGPDLSAYLTHDKAITERHRKDEEDGIRSSKATIRFASELFKAQRWILNNFLKWNHPTIAFIAGTDYLSAYRETERLFQSVDPKLITYMIYKDNYHENFNEINRNEIFDKIYEWLKTIVKI